MNFKELYLQMDSCTRCGLCTEACPVMRVRGLDKAPLLTTIFPGFGTRWDVYTLTDLLAQSTGCGACREACPLGIDIPEAINWIRADAARKKGSSKAVLDLVRNVADQGNPWGEPCRDRGKALAGKGAGSAKALYFPGCQSVYRNPEVVRAWEKVCEVAGVEFTTLGENDACCGAWLANWGERDKAAVQAGKVAAAIKTSGAEVLVTTCPHCLAAFANLYPELGVQLDLVLKHSTEFIIELLSKGMFKLNPKAGQIAYHEPCYLRRLPGQAGIKEVLTAAGYKAKALSAPLKPACCGAGEGVSLICPEVAKDMAAAMLADAKKLGAETIVTACPYCLENLTQEAAGQFKVADVLELVTEEG